jgi:RNA polymerase sigma-70 factor (ECF subfamily)
MEPRPPWHEAVASHLAGCATVDLAAARAHVAAAVAAGASVVHAADLALAFAVAAGDPVAARRFEALVGRDLVASVRAVDRTPAFVDEVAQDLRVKLTVGDRGAPRIASYRGTGPLVAWVAVAARRAALNAKRAARRTPVVDPLVELADREPDPELRHLRQLYRTEFRDALAAALAAASDRDRALLRLRFVEGLELAQLGRMYRVHESTASRWLAAARAQVAEAARLHLMVRLTITTATADSVARMVVSGLDLSLARLLGAGADAAERA